MDENGIDDPEDRRELTFLVRELDARMRMAEAQPSA